MQLEKKELVLRIKKLEQDTADKYLLVKMLQSIYLFKFLSVHVFQFDKVFKELQRFRKTTKIHIPHAVTVHLD